jgi:hypothetical protein
MFRMKRDRFEKLYNTLEPLPYAPNEAMAQRSLGSMASNKTKLYCTLRKLAGGSYLDICLAYGVSGTDGCRFAAAVPDPMHAPAYHAVLHPLL